MKDKQLMLKKKKKDLKYFQTQGLFSSLKLRITGGLVSLPCSHDWAGGEELLRDTFTLPQKLVSVQSNDWMDYLLFIYISEWSSCRSCWWSTVYCTWTHYRNTIQRFNQTDNLKGRRTTDKSKFEPIQVDCRGLTNVNMRRPGWMFGYRSINNLKVAGAISTALRQYVQFTARFWLLTMRHTNWG